MAARQNRIWTNDKAGTDVIAVFIVLVYKFQTKLADGAVRHAGRIHNAGTGFGRIFVVFGKNIRTVRSDLDLPCTPDRAAVRFLVLPLLPDAASF